MFWEDDYIGFGALKIRLSRLFSLFKDLEP